MAVTYYQPQFLCFSSSATLLVSGISSIPNTCVKSNILVPIGGLGVTFLKSVSINFSTKKFSDFRELMRRHYAKE